MKKSLKRDENRLLLSMMDQIKELRIENREILLGKENFCFDWLAHLSKERGLHKPSRSMPKLIEAKPKIIYSAV